MKDLVSKINESSNKVSTKEHGDLYDIVNLSEEQLQLIIDLLESMKNKLVKIKDGNTKQVEINKDRYEYLRSLAAQLYVDLC